MRPIVERIVATARALATSIPASSSTQSTNGYHNGHDAARQGLEARLRQDIDALSAAGAELKDLERGLIDFMGRYRGRPIYLCWLLGEDDITHYHELDAGFAGRQPLPEDLR